MESGNPDPLEVKTNCNVTDFKDAVPYKDNGLENSDSSSKDNFGLKESSKLNDKELDDSVPTKSKIRDKDSLSKSDNCNVPESTDYNSAGSVGSKSPNFECNKNAVEAQLVAKNDSAQKQDISSLELDILGKSPSSDSIPLPASDEEDSFLQDNSIGEISTEAKEDDRDHPLTSDSKNNDQNSALGLNSCESGNPKGEKVVGLNVKSDSALQNKKNVEANPESQKGESDILSDVSENEMDFELGENSNSGALETNDDVLEADDDTIKNCQSSNRSTVAIEKHNETKIVLSKTKGACKARLRDSGLENISDSSQEYTEPTTLKPKLGDGDLSSGDGNQLPSENKKFTEDSETYYILDETSNQSENSLQSNHDVENTSDLSSKPEETGLKKSGKDIERADQDVEKPHPNIAEQTSEKSDEDIEKADHYKSDGIESIMRKNISDDLLADSVDTEEPPKTVSPLSSDLKDDPAEPINENAILDETRKDVLDGIDETSSQAISDDEALMKPKETVSKVEKTVEPSSRAADDIKITEFKINDLSSEVVSEADESSSQSTFDKNIKLQQASTTKPSAVKSKRSSETSKDLPKNSRKLSPTTHQEEDDKDDDICIEFDSSKVKSSIASENLIDLTDDLDPIEENPKSVSDDMDYDDDFDPSSLVAVEHSIVDDPLGEDDSADAQPPELEKIEKSSSQKSMASGSTSKEDDEGKSDEEIVKSVLGGLVDSVLGTKSSDDASKDSEILLDEKACTECKINKGLKYQVLFQGRTHYLCSDQCFHLFRGHQKLAPPPANMGLPRLTSVKETCSVCRLELKGGQGFVPLDADSSKPVCSEECMKRFQQEHGAKQVCAQCSAHIEGRTKCLTWETMEFCNEDCLGKYQTHLGSFCACCKSAVQRLSLGKYCVRFGFDIRQFCSGKCLEEFKKGLKVCTFCQKDLTGSAESFLAPVGTKGQFKDFCTQECMSQYETMNSSARSTPKQKQCSVCKKLAPVKVQVIFNNQDHMLCSDPCVAAFRYANKIVTKICDTCNKFFKTPSSALQFEGTSKRFCTKSCMNLFVLSHRKIVPCTWCKVKKYNFDMIERVDSNNHVQLFCSLNCLSLFRVSLNATSSKSVQCDHCKNYMPAQYHLTMSDASIRNFCTYQCVIAFQSQFTSVPTLTTVSPRVPATGKTVTTATVVTKPSVTVVNTTPVISSVISLAPSNGPQGVRPVVSSTQGARPIGQPVVVAPIRAQAGATAINAPRMTSQASNINLGAVITTKASPVPGAAINLPATATASTGTCTAVHVVREIVVRPTQPKMMKNKMILCRPMMQTKGVACKPHPCHKCTQTDELPDVPPGFIPIPVPIFVPVPMHMYSRQVPLPLPFPLPVPVPVFIPTTKATAAQIAKDISEIKEKIPDNPFEAELLMMAEMVAEGERNNDDFLIEESKSSCDTFRNRSEQEFDVSKLQEPVLDLETALELPTFESQLNRSIDEHGPLSLASMSSVADDSSSEQVVTKEVVKRGSNKKRRGGANTRSSRGRKKAKVAEASASEDSNELGVSLDSTFQDIASRSTEQLSSPDAKCCLKFMFGVNAWKHWVVQKNGQLEKGSRRLKLFKTDLLQLSADELNYSLCLFVKEVRKPNGEQYASDSIYYLCLGIQMYLFENGRIDNIFTDSYYEKFTECLNEVVQKQDTTVTREGHYISRIEEEILWESKQLGAHSPQVLLNTLMYFNSKFFFLRSVEEHMKLNFSQVMKHWRKTSTSVTTGKGASEVTIPAGTKVSVLRYYPPPVNTDRKSKKEEPVVLEQVENIHNVLRCPVKLYEFYLSKCVKTRSDIFYLYPERSCVPDSPVWYSAQPLGKETISKMLNRIQMMELPPVCRK